MSSTKKKKSREISRREWSGDEDRRLLLAVNAHQGHEWESIASLMTGRTAIECLSHYQTMLNPNLIRNTWTIKEEDTLISMYKKMERARSDRGPVPVYHFVAAQLPGRTPSQCRERWLKSSAPQVYKGRWTDLECIRLRLAFDSYGEEYWQMRTHLPRRSDAQCRDKGGPRRGDGSKKGIGFLVNRNKRSKVK